MANPDPMLTDPGDLVPEIDLGRAYVFCDFDGTLVDIAPTPDSIDVAGDLADTLNRMVKILDGRFAVVSGRPVPDIERFLPGYTGDIWGAHGAASRRGGTLKNHPLTGSDAVARFQTAARHVGERHGTLVEMKPTGGVLHYRSKPALEQALHAEAVALLAENEGFELHASKMAWELRPTGASKGGAVTQELADRQPGLIPVVFGDDVTDEEAMTVAIAEGGFGVRIGGGKTQARFRLKDTAAMRDLLKRIIKETAS